MTKYTTRAYNTIFTKDNGLIVKVSKNEKLHDESEYYRTISRIQPNSRYSHLKMYFPTMIASYNNEDSDGPNHYLELEELPHSNFYDHMKNYDTDTVLESFRNLWTTMNKLHYSF